MVLIFIWQNEIDRATSAMTLDFEVALLPLFPSCLYFPPAPLMFPPAFLSALSLFTPLLLP